VKHVELLGWNNSKFTIFEVCIQIVRMKHFTVKKSYPEFVAGICLEISPFSLLENSKFVFVTKEKFGISTCISNI